MKTNKPDSASDTTHFGFETVSKEDKAGRVADVFHTVAKKYDLMNDLMSFGVHRLWKRQAINLLGVHRGQHILDLAGGTGDLTKLMHSKIGNTGHIVLSDINSSMLSVGRDRMIDAGLSGNVSFQEADAEKLPFEDNQFDRVVMAFGLRNVTNKEAALQSIYRVLKPGGRLVVLEFSKPLVPGLQPIYDAYSFKVLPKIGKLILDDENSYRYLAESIRKHPDQETLKNMMDSAGFENCDYHNLTGGIVAIHRGFKF